MFDKKSADIKIEGFDVNDPACWIKINPKLTGFYRVRIRPSVNVHSVMLMSVTVSHISMDF